MCRLSGRCMMVAPTTTIRLMSCQQLIAELQDNLLHATTPVVDFCTLNNLPAQETGHVVLSLSTSRHLPRLQPTVDNPPIVVAWRSLRTTI